MNKQTIAYIITGVAAVAGIATFGYYRTTQVETCSTILEKYSENHACVRTSKGVMIFELYKDAAPKSLARFSQLADTDKLYDDMEIYSVAKNVLIQGGVRLRVQDISNIQNLNEKDSLIKKWSEQTFESEANFAKLGLAEDVVKALAEEKYTSTEGLNSRPFEYGSLGFINNGAGTASTEFMILTAKDAKSETVAPFNGRITNMGKLIEGASVLDAINNVEVSTENPQFPVPLQKIEMYEVRTK